MKTLTSNSVAKLGTNLPCFNIPALITCIGKTKICSKECYAIKGRFTFPTTKNKHKWNLKESKKANFVDRVKGEISTYYFNGLNRFRIHSSGDFYSQKYLLKWYDIINQFPKMTFVAYTRSHQLDFRNKPKNLNLYYSTDDSTEHYPAYKGLMPKTKLVHTFEEHVKTKKSLPCVSHCHTCKICYLPKQKFEITFKKH